MVASHTLADPDRMYLLDHLCDHRYHQSTASTVYAIATHNSSGYRHFNRIFYGQWKEGKADGEGVHKCFNGDKYIGQFKNNKMHGVGRYTYKNGTEYYGQWEYNKPNGQGILFKKHGNYQGEWKDSKKHGNGVYENFITEKIYTQRWFNDQKIGDERVF